MFFALSKQQDNRFPHHQELVPGVWLSHDDGWHRFPHVTAKGYAMDRTLLEAAYSSARGNYCAFVRRADAITIQHDRDRSFPLWASATCITNLEPCGEPVWADCTLTVDAELTITREYQEPTPTPAGLTDAAIVDQVHDTLLATFDAFLGHNRLPIKMFVTGGVDTTLAWAYLDHFTQDYEMVDYEYIKFTPFWKRNRESLRRFWGYRQVHLWDEPCVMVSGAMGDENFLRGPNTLEMMLRAHGTSLEQELTSTDYHHKHFRKYIDAGLDVGTVDPDITKVREKVMQINSNDHQHWHLDNTLHFTPFKDSRLLALILQSSRDLLTAQARNAAINRQLIQRLDPAKLAKVSAFKNDQALENL
jgi:hypothetical protein